MILAVSVNTWWIRPSWPLLLCGPLALVFVFPFSSPPLFCNPLSDRLSNSSIHSQTRKSKGKLHRCPILCSFCYHRHRAGKHQSGMAKSDGSVVFDGAYAFGQLNHAFGLILHNEPFVVSDHFQQTSSGRILSKPFPAGFFWCKAFFLLLQLYQVLGSFGVSLSSCSCSYI